MNALSIYEDNFGNTHAAAVQAVYDAGLAAGLAAAATVIQPDAVAAPTLDTIAAELAALAAATP